MVASAADEKRQEERRVKELRDFQRSTPANRRCFDCNEMVRSSGVPARHGQDDLTLPPSSPVRRCRSTSAWTSTRSCARPAAASSTPRLAPTRWVIAEGLTVVERGLQPRVRSPRQVHLHVQVLRDGDQEHGQVWWQRRTYQSFRPSCCNALPL
jgi:hypothetical protein